MLDRVLAVGLMKIENLIRYTELAVGLMEIENLIRYAPRAVGLKPSASQGEARLRGLLRSNYSTTIRPRLAREVVSGMKEWRIQHPRATWKELEEALDQRLNESDAGAVAGGYGVGQ